MTTDRGTATGQTGGQDSLTVFRDAAARVALEGRCPDARCDRGWADCRCPNDHYAALGIDNPRDGGRKMDQPGMVATALWRGDGTVVLP